MSWCVSMIVNYSCVQFSQVLAFVSMLGDQGRPPVLSCKYYTSTDVWNMLRRHCSETGESSVNAYILVTFYICPCFIYLYNALYINNIHQALFDLLYNLNFVTFWLYKSNLFLKIGINNSNINKLCILSVIWDDRNNNRINQQPDLHVRLDGRANPMAEVIKLECQISHYLVKDRRLRSKRRVCSSI